MRVSVTSDRSLRAWASEALGWQGPTNEYTGVIDFWERMLRKLDETSGIVFLDSLSRAEFTSLSILREWWCRYRPIAQSFIFHRIRRSARRGTQISSTIPFFFDLEVHGAFYHHAVSLLFIRELTPERVFREMLATLRDRAARVASTHAIAGKFCIDSASKYPITAGQNVTDVAQYDPLFSNRHQSKITATVEACPWLSSEQYNGRPYYLWDVARKCTVRAAEVGMEPYICISHTWGRWILTDSENKPQKAIVKGVLWPIPKNSKFDVQSLPELLQNANLPEKYVWFDLLCIPQCGYQQDIMDSEIARQAAIFGTSHFTGAWLNDIDDWNGTRHAMAWLSGQYFLQTSWGSGFRFGDTAPHFINAPQIESPISNVDLSVLEQNAHCPANILSEEQDQVPSWFTSLWTLQEFCLRPDMILYDKHWRPLRIDDEEIIHLDELIAFMHFAQTTMLRHGSFYIFHADFANQIRWDSFKDKFREIDRVEKELDTITYERPDIKAIWPAGPVELALLTAGTNLLHYYQGPSKILRFGDMRQCSGRRAEAIMSALGATKWYPEYMNHVTVASGQVVYEPNLVLGKYPVDFLNEVVRIIGSDFFASRLSFIGMGPHDIQKTFSSSMTPIGSLLPFSAGPIGLGFQTNQHLELETKIQDHPTVKSWVVQADGTVKITEAGIMATSQRSRASRLSKLVHLPKVLRAKPHWARIRIDAPLLFEKGECDLWITSQDELCAAIPTNVALYMVCLGDGVVESYGVILQHIACEGGPMKIMVKVGMWYSFNPSRPKDPTAYKFRHESDIVPTTAVNWKVV